MKCNVRRTTGGIAVVCGVGRREGYQVGRCACGKQGSLQCDGLKTFTLEGAISQLSTTGTCDASICLACANHVGYNRDLCAECVLAGRKAQP